MTVNDKERLMGATCGTRIRRRRQELGMTQLNLAEKTGLSEAAVRSYELGTRNPKDAHRKRERQQPFRLGQGEDGPRTDGRGAGEASERERPEGDSFGA